MSRYLGIYEFGYNEIDKVSPARVEGDYAVGDWYYIVKGTEIDKTGYQRMEYKPNGRGGFFSMTTKEQVDAQRVKDAEPTPIVNEKFEEEGYDN